MRYRVLAPLGHGGMASVHLARAEDGRLVALKRLHPQYRDSAETAALLLREARLTARVAHPNVVKVYDVGEDEDGPFVAMEYVEGATLAELGPLPAPIALAILAEALAGLAAVHALTDEAGIPLGAVHRDFSPQNILVGVDGAVKLIDLGIAKVARAETHTRSGLIKGKVGYVSPEQARGRRLDRRSDVWAAGVIAWELLAGRRLCADEDEVATLVRVVSQTPPRVRSIRPEIPAALDEAIAWALTIDPDARCPSAEALRDRLLQAAAALGPPAGAPAIAARVREVAAGPLADRRRRLEAAAASGRTRRVRTAVLAGCAAVAAALGLWAIAARPPARTPPLPATAQTAAPAPPPAPAEAANATGTGEPAPAPPETAPPDRPRRRVTRPRAPRRGPADELAPPEGSVAPLEGNPYNIRRP